MTKTLTHNNNPSGSEQLPIPSNTDLHTWDIASVYTYGELSENITTTESNNNNMEITMDNPDEYSNQTFTQKSSINLNQPDQYPVNSITFHRGNPNTWGKPGI
jgi:hypothetical protein